MTTVAAAVVVFHTTCRRFGTDELVETVHGAYCADHAPAARTWRAFAGLPERAARDGEVCQQCEGLAKQTAMWDAEVPKVRAALLSDQLAHTRFRNGTVYVYHRDSTSPTGVRMAAGLPADRYELLAAELRGQVFQGSLSPLSPTEGR